MTLHTYKKSALPQTTEFRQGTKGGCALLNKYFFSVDRYLIDADSATFTIYLSIGNFFYRFDVGHGIAGGLCKGSP